MRDVSMSVEFKRIVNNRPVGLICPGYSVQYLDENIKKFQSKDICWGTLNFHPDGNEILKKIDKHVEFMIAYCPPWKNASFRGFKLIKAEARGGSVHEFLLMCVDNDLDMTIFTFGLDGYPSNKKFLYYKDRTRSNPYDMYINDTKTFNTTFPQERKNVRIFNCSPGTKIEVLDNITIEECLKEISWLEAKSV